MAIIKWNDSYSVGVKKLDDQHKKLIDMINQLHDAMKVGKGNQEIASVINGLVDYTVFHFGDEEKLFKEYNYPGFIVHENKHKEFVTKVKEFQDEVNSGKLAVSMKVNQFLKDWLIEHIVGVDKKYGPFLNNKGIN